ncbi:MAG: DUF4012 domain-containing protein [Candidatus Moranbacteria bacterium]|nr:DUF4012 domain-containing protein [Candidatus Moranbacteria bacterium]
MQQYLTRKNIVIAASIVALAIGGFFLVSFGRTHKQILALNSLSLFEKVSKLLPIEADTKAEIEAVNTLASKLSQKDDITRTFMVMLQNNYELRPGGGFLGQYAILKVKNGEIISSFVEDANLLDQRITATITPPYPFKQIQLKKWKFRDSNFSPDFPTNVDKAQYFYRLAGGREQFDGVIAVNANVFDHILDITGPIEMPGYGTYASADASMKLEENVEKPFLGEDVPAELKQNRKAIMKKIAAEIISRISTLNNIPKLATFAQTELRDKNIMIWFKDPSLQSIVSGVHWDGTVSDDWESDYVMVVDANLGALKSDYWVKRSLDYSVDFTAGPKPVATVSYTYDHTATHGDWRTSDYHTYTRILAPLGSKYIENSRVKTGGVLSQDSTDFNKTIFGYKVDAVMNQALATGIKYELPDTIKADGYQLLIQKQSGIGNIPVTVHIKTDKGEFTQEATLAKDLKFNFTEVEEKK